MLKTLNGWPVLSSIPSATFVAPNGKTVYVANADVAEVFRHIAERWHKEIEPLPKATYNEAPRERSGLIVIHAWRPAGVGVERSNHQSGTAMDINGHLHHYEPSCKTGKCGYGRPHLPYTDGFTTGQRNKLRQIARELKAKDGKSIIRLGIDFAPGYRDGMHVEIAPGTTAAEVRYVADRLRAQRGPVKGIVPLPPKGIKASIATGNKAPALTKIIQERCRYFDPKLEIDGVFGAKTDRAVKMWQKALGVTPDGVVGPVTVRADLAFYGIQKRGSRGSGVKWIQYAVAVPVDGVYGPVTEEGVKRRQVWAGLDPDGVFGPKSRRHIIIAP